MRASPDLGEPEGDPGDPAGEEALPPLADTSGLKEPPSTARGARTRAALVSAARTVFERDGFIGSRLTDITAEAHCATGTFYVYFAGKDEIFAAVLEEAQNDMLHPGMPHVAETDDPARVIEAANRAYLTAYRRNGQLMKLLQQVAMVDPKFQELRSRRGEKFAVRNARHIADLQARGLADPTLDPLMASRALSSMVSRMALDCLVLGDFELEHVVEITTKLWINGLKLSDADSG
ncbi:transcriptional regulator, TetR family [Frankineae bacterium MT45]|nr:transcriptional regulator, TetR family [Frankineae bacterium MT45]